jgi:hypothetical protein
MIKPLNENGPAEQKDEPQLHDFKPTKGARDVCRVCGKDFYGEPPEAVAPDPKPERPRPDEAINLLVAVRDSAVTDAGTCSICLLDPHSPGCVIELVEKFVQRLDEAEGAVQPEQGFDCGWHANHSTHEEALACAERGGQPEQEACMSAEEYYLSEKGPCGQFWAFGPGQAVWTFAEAYAKYREHVRRKP